MIFKKHKSEKDVDCDCNTESETAPKSKKKKLIIISVLLLVAIIAAAVAFFVFSEENSPQAVAEKYLTAEAEYDAESMTECFPDFLIGLFAEEMGISNDRDVFEQKIQQSFDAVGENVTVQEFKVLSCEIDEDYYTEEEKKTFIENGKKEYGVVIEDVCMVNVSLSYSGEKPEVTVTTVKIDGEWYVIPSL